MDIGQQDPVTGRHTTGHDWNGIKELDTPIPRVVFAFLGAAFLFSLLWWVLMPAWPLVTTYTKGILGADQRKAVEAQLASARTERSAWTARVADTDWKAIQADKALMADVEEAGHQLFGDNCAACHGADATGGIGYPNLTDRDWIWGGGPERIAETIRVGVNSSSSDARVSQMPAFGRDQILSAAEIDTVAQYVLSLSDPSVRTPENVEKIRAGKDLFAANCAACHGEDGKGMQDAGVPNLTDNYWIYGGDIDTILQTLHGGRQGHMPTWEKRLTPVQIKVLALYVDAMKAEQ